MRGTGPVLERASCLAQAALAGRTARLRTCAAAHSRSSGSDAVVRQAAAKQGKGGGHTAAGSRSSGRDAAGRQADKKQGKGGEHVYPSKGREKARQAEHDRRASRWESSGASRASEDWHHFFDDKWVHTQGRLSDWNPTEEQQDGTWGRSARDADKPASWSEARVRSRSRAPAPKRRRGEQLPPPVQPAQESQPHQQPSSGDAQDQQAVGCHFFATCHPGLEPAVAAELEGPAIGAQQVSQGSAGVDFWGPDMATGLRACVWLRSAIRVLVLLAEGPVDTGLPSGDFIYAWTRQAAHWPDLLPRGQRFGVEAHVWSCSTITTSLLARTRIRDAVCDAIRSARGEKLWPPDKQRPAHLPLYATLFRDHVRLFRDMAGVSLHRRGYRQVMHKASLNEAAAAGMLALAGWPRSQETVLADPMCGSGSLLIEAALLVRNRAPNLDRRIWPFQAWPDLQPSAWRDVRAAAGELQAAAPRFEGRLLGNDVHEGALGLARRGAEAAGVADMISFSSGNCRDWQPPARPELVVVNPPWGQRLGEGPPRVASSARGSGNRAGAGVGPPESELVTAWRDLGAFLKGQCRNAEAWVLSGNRSLGSALQLKAAKKIPIGIGGMDCRLLKYEVFPPKSA